MLRNEKGFVEIVVVLALILLLVGAFTHLSVVLMRSKLEEANQQGYVITHNGLNKYSVKLIEQRESTDENWTPVK